MSAGILKINLINPSFTKPFGTNIFYQGERGSDGPPAISETVAQLT